MKKIFLFALTLLMVFNVVSFAAATPSVPDVNVEVTTEPESEGFFGLSLTTWLIILVAVLLVIILVSSASRGRK